MNQGAKVGLGVAGGYVLGRRRKMRLALGLGAYLLGKRMNLSPAQLAMSGTQALKGMPEFAELGTAMRNELLTAGRRAAATAMTHRLESIADSLSERTESLDGGGSAGKPGRNGRKKSPRVIDLTAAESGEYAYPDDRDDSGGGRSRTREASRARGSSRPRRRGSDADDEPEDVEDEYDDDEEPEDVEDDYDDEGPEDVEDEYDDEPEDVEDDYDDDDEEPDDVEDEYDDEGPEDVEDEYDDEPEDVEDEYDDEPDDVEDEERSDRRSPSRASGRSRRRQPARR